MIFLLPLEMTCKPTAHTTPLFPNYHCFLLLIALGFFVCFVLWLWSLKTQRAGLLLTNLSVAVAALSGRQSHSIAVHSPIFHLDLRSYYPRKWKAIAIYQWEKNSLFSICPQLFHHQTLLYSREACNSEPDTFSEVDLHLICGFLSISNIHINIVIQHNLEYGAQIYFSSYSEIIT